MAPRDYDIIVVGAGMVGSSMALRLAASGLRIALVAPSLERKLDTHQYEEFDPRVVALTAASRELFERLGIWPELARQRVCPYRKMHVWDGEGSGKIDFSAAELGCEALGHIVENRLIVAELMTALKSSGVTMITGEVAGLIYTEAGVGGVTLADGDSFHSGLTIAADGAQSALRDFAGIGVREWSYGQSAIVTTVRTAQHHQHTAWQRFMATGPLAFLPLCESPDDVDSRYSSIVWSADQSFAASLMALNDTDFAERLAQSFEHCLGAVEQVAKRHCIPLVQRHARTYFQPGLALVGDAAHSIHPLAGQGVNLGLLDVEALAQEILRAQNRGVAMADVSILRRYERERMGHNLTMMAAMESFKRLFGARDLRLLWLRNCALRSADSLPLLKNTLAREAMGLSLS
ncbi:UbiH/UbiF/VisC/COQ6 family ubiquinone biosynthesis hydroxylase [Gilvimarinus sp. DA14]|uniref:UbiH/UbiF/VisC/COQ6 family ubiquinone biosynthesis hydroxylase n=1 Tax=Gilvimarinus sp. DA14 TaxID=2956798 RepID=UPI0020B64B48|nr:UbiH/UbiF/VisC/COQ6 family ubiquinone biosynthesis hydroxylase [Gilvimarinus sp. DA14]UTF59242.1 UbiH/UbiF/VisC/COQ6 family ubiquinone biosynthesis hydroxylase [Gilvimarinus sp. DA14]